MSENTLTHYIDSELPDNTTINNIDFFDNHIIVENSEGEEVKYEYTDKLYVRIFAKLELETMRDFINLSHHKKVYVITSFDCEADATFNTFPEEPFYKEIQDDKVDIDDFENLCNTCWGLLEGKEKEITFKQLQKIIN